MKKVSLKLKNKNLPIYIGNNIFVGSTIANHIKHKDVVIITNTKIANLHLKKVKRSLKGFLVKTLILPDGEKYKNINTLNKIHDYLIKNKFNRDLTVIALGGGVIGDLVAFASDTFLRGVNLIQIPTTLLAQVDSSIGGKAGINHQNGKNLIGSFKHPEAIFIDIMFLKTLSNKQYIAGLAEVVKYGAIGNSVFLKWLNKNSKAILSRKTEFLIKLISISVKAKVDVVQQDEKESNIRAHLNFGHTLGHAIESAMKYKGILHGEAVSIGMNFAAAISVEQSTLEIMEYNLLEDTLLKLGLPIHVPSSISDKSIMKHMSFDKKKKNGKNHLVLLESIGKSFICDKLTDSYISKFVKTFQS